ncbi:hypothetical protein E4T38_01792 [Aureobasidium subglaciale]|nr:hypothetical protein E4T38_01792 [Aureobasidium subglaciale]KAI5229382.1 hypothetical protein E4T40_01688 [Aureobasidium subglaciale]KAI5232873.1 hypothetical protein E4T41_01790 [Aureobasidium subglaciale]KAI5266389.1 hypothetical protein E4T46_01685 [Aureobasidium subglaciale]
MTPPFLHTQKPVGVSVTLKTVTREGAPSTGPSTRTLVIPKDGSVLIGRASTSSAKGRSPASDNGLFECAVMSRSHASISAPNGPHGSLVLEDTGSMHGVFVNGRKITLTEIFDFDEIRFGSQVTRAEGEYLHFDQAFNFSERTYLTPHPAVHDGVQVKITNIARQGANFTALTNFANLANGTKPNPPPSYRVPDYDTDSSADHSAELTFHKTPTMHVIDLDPVSSPVRSRSLEIHQFEEDGSENDCDSDLESDYESNDYPDDPDELDEDGEQSISASDRSDRSDRSESPGLSEAWDDYPREDEVDFDSDDLAETHGQPQQPTSLYSGNPKPQESWARLLSEKEKVRDATEAKMSIPWLVDSTLANDWNVPAPFSTSVTQTFDIPKAPSPLICHKAGIAINSVEEKKKDVDAGDILAQELKLSDAVSRALELEDQELETSASPETAKVEEKEKVAAPTGAAIAELLTNVVEEKEVAPTPTAAELFAKVDSPIGGKRKRETNDDGREEVTTPAPGHKLLKLRFGQQHKNTLQNLFKKQVTTTPRPIKRVKRSTAKSALKVFASAMGGAAAMVGVLMTPQCEQWLANWPIQ